MSSKILPGQLPFINARLPIRSESPVYAVDVVGDGNCLFYALLASHGKECTETAAVILRAELCNKTFSSFLFRPIFNVIHHCTGDYIVLHKEQYVKDVYDTRGHLKHVIEKVQANKAWCGQEAIQAYSDKFRVGNHMLLSRTFT